MPITRRDFLAATPAIAAAQDRNAVPIVDGPWWTVAGNPDLGPLSSVEQEPVDFGIWQAADGTWQLWSCIRKTKEAGRTRLLYRWQGAQLTDENWEPMGIAMRADPNFGETPGGLQAPFVLKLGEEYNLFYGDWRNICRAKGWDGKTFARVLNAQGRPQLFSEDAPDQAGDTSNSRDVMIIHVGSLWHAYYTAHPNRSGSVYLRTSRDLNAWSTSRIVARGGSAGTGPFTAECPFVYPHGGSYLLFRTQRYGKDAQTSVYRSNDPADFGVESDKCLVTTLPVAAPEIFDYRGQTYMAALLPSLKGIQIAKLAFRQG